MKDIINVLDKTYDVALKKLYYDHNHILQVGSKINFHNTNENFEVMNTAGTIIEGIDPFTGVKIQNSNGSFPFLYNNIAQDEGDMVFIRSADKLFSPIRTSNMSIKGSYGYNIDTDFYSFYAVNISENNCIHNLKKSLYLTNAGGGKLNVNLYMNLASTFRKVYDKIKTKYRDLNDESEIKFVRISKNFINSTYQTMNFNYNNIFKVPTSEISDAADSIFTINDLCENNDTFTITDVTDYGNAYADYYGFAIQLSNEENAILLATFTNSGTNDPCTFNFPLLYGIDSKKLGLVTRSDEITIDGEIYTVKDFFIQNQLTIAGITPYTAHYIWYFDSSNSQYNTLRMAFNNILLTQADIFILLDKVRKNNNENILNKKYLLRINRTSEPIIKCLIYNDMVDDNIP